MNDTIEYKGYFAIVDFSSEDDVLYGKITGTDDLVSFEGTSVAELKAAFHKAAEDYLDMCKELNKDPDKTYKGSFNVRIPFELHRKAAIVAARKKVTPNDFVNTAIDALVKKSDHELVQ